MLGGDKDLLQTASPKRLVLPAVSGAAMFLRLLDVPASRPVLVLVKFPFYERWYLGGTEHLRGFKYRSISPREGNFSEPIGRQHVLVWLCRVLSVPIFQQDKERGVGIRFAAFYDVGNG